MKQKQKCSIFNKFRKLIRSLLSNLQPRYQLALDHDVYDINLKRNIYCFKSFGDHSFLKLTFDQIKYNNDLLYTINPRDLMKICLEEVLLEQRLTKLRVSEMLRDNKFVLTDKSSHQIFSGEEICDNALLMERINNIDLYKIAFNTGFNQGRSLSKIANKKKRENSAYGNVIALPL